MIAVALFLAVAVEPTITTWVELDTNARRIPTAEPAPGHLEPPVDAPTPIADGLVRADASFEAKLERPGLVLRTDNAFGLKLFFHEATERMLVAQTQESMTAPVFGDAVLDVSVLGKARAQLSGARTYAYLYPRAVVEKAVFANEADGVSIEAGVEGVAFHSFDIPLFSNAGASALVGARAVSGPESALFTFELGGTGFPFASTDPEHRNPARRTDGKAIATLEATSARTLFLRAGYTLVRNGSNALGEGFTKNRFSALVGFRLPGEVDCIAKGTLQITSYDQGLSVGQIYFPDYLEDNQNIFEVTLRRRLLGGLSAVGHVSFIGNELAVQNARFSRETAGIGIQADL